MRSIAHLAGPDLMGYVHALFVHVRSTAFSCQEARLDNMLNMLLSFETKHKRNTQLTSVLATSE